MSEETRHSSKSAFLSALLDRGPLNAGVFFSGSVCGQVDFPADSEQGYVHLLRRGSVSIVSNGQVADRLARPGLVLFARPSAHRFVIDDDVGANLVCARLSFDNLLAHPQLLGFPDRLVIPFDETENLQPAAEQLFREAFAADFGREPAVNLLVELLLIYIIRHCVDAGRMDRGLLSALGDPKLARVIVALHEDVTAPWSIESLADLAGMSRASFAAHFKDRVGTSPGSYLTTVRLTLARQRLKAGEPLKAVAAQVGYKSATALSRTLQRHFGYTPRDWQKGG